MQPLLNIENLRKHFRAGRSATIRALDGVDLVVYPGETLGLVGESGCGKTTLARCALNLLEPTSGSVKFDGMDLRRLPPSVLRRKRREFQIIVQDALGSLDPRMTIERILAEPFELQGLGTPRERRSWVDELLETVALDRSMAERLPASLSGGQQQRVVIARALALRPRLLVADEPVSSLDASIQAQILNLLAALQKRYNLTLLLISHSLPVVHYLASRVAVMYLGRVVEEAPADHFFRSPKHPYSRALLQSMPVLDHAFPGDWKARAGETPSAANPPAGCHFHPRCPVAITRCANEYPALFSCGAKIKVACFLYTGEHI